VYAASVNARRNPLRFFLLLYALVAGGLAAFLYWWLLHPVVAWIVASNACAFGLWGWDKWRAQHGAARLPEMALHVMAFTGATPASFAAMSVFRHKTLKKSFRITYSVFLVVQLVALTYWMFPPRT
jgi:uncharacterized membrane protein YsdA (DUF1294 family)